MIDELAWRCDGAGRTTTLVRDSLHRVYRVDYPATPGYPAFSVEGSFDRLGRLVSLADASGTGTFAYDPLDRLTSHVPAVGSPVSYGYLKDLLNGRWIEQATLSGTGTWEFREDGKGREAEVVSPFGQLTARRFDLEGKLLQESRPNGTVSDYSYTARGWLAGIQHRLAGGAVLDPLGYYYADAAGVYDPTGHLRRETDAGGRVHAFSYNRHYELTGESHPDFGSAAYTLDRNGNRTSWSMGGVTTWAGYDLQNRLLWTNGAGNLAPAPNQGSPYRLYEHDGAGQPVRLEHKETSGPGGVTIDQYDWDGMGKLRRLYCVGTSQERYRAGYDGAGTRVTSRLDGIDHTYSYGAGLLRDEAGAAGSTVYTPGVSQRKNGVDHYFHQDWIGSTRYLTDASGLGVPSAYRFDAFGNVSAFAGSDATVLKFAGGWGYQADTAGGLLLLGARYYVFDCCQAVVVTGFARKRAGRVAPASLAAAGRTPFVFSAGGGAAVESALSAPAPPAPVTVDAAGSSRCCRRRSSPAPRARWAPVAASRRRSWRDLLPLFRSGRVSLVTSS